MKRERFNHSIQTAFILVVFCVFIMTTLVVLISGVKSYSSISKKLSSRCESRICANYILSKTKYNEENDNIYLGKFNKHDALYIDQNIDGVVYNTIIYDNKGILTELTCEKGSVQNFGSGNKIAKINSIDFKQSSRNLIKITCTDDDKESQNIYIALRTGGER